MALTNASFNLSKSTKRILALGKFKSVEQRNGWKRAMIDAEHTAEIAKKTLGKRSKQDRSDSKND